MQQLNTNTTMANFRNDWENALKIANEDLAEIGAEIKIERDEDGYYSCVISYNNGEYKEDYAENFVEHELERLITDAEQHAKNQIISCKKMAETDRDFYDSICKVLTWYEHPEEYPFGEDVFKEDAPELMYDLLVKVQNKILEQNEMF